MLNRTKHEMTMRNVIHDIYTDKVLSPLLGFKGGTACYFFYSLPRFSVDMDFNLIQTDKKQEVYERLSHLLPAHGQLKDVYIKRNTLFFYVVHTPRCTGIKVEVSTRTIEGGNEYKLQEFYGTSILVMKQEYIFANKLIALTARHKPAARDLFDIHYFFSQYRDIAEDFVEEVTGKHILTYLSGLPDYINTHFDRSNIHEGLGELVADESQRDFVKHRLIKDTIRLIRIYVDAAKK